MAKIEPATLSEWKQRYQWQGYLNVVSAPRNDKRAAICASRVVCMEILANAHHRMSSSATATIVLESSECIALGASRVEGHPTEAEIDERSITVYSMDKYVSSYPWVRAY
jgi:hypothetical protein